MRLRGAETRHGPEIYFGRAAGDAWAMESMPRWVQAEPAIVAPNFTGPVVSPSGEPRLLGVDMIELERQVAMDDAHWEAIGFIDELIENMRAQQLAGHARYRRDWT